MPIYDHVCDHCGHAFSVVRSFNDPPVEACPNCGKKPRRLIAPPAIVFKGAGWYKTDSRGPAPKDTAAKDGARPSESTTSDTAKPETPKTDTSGSKTGAQTS